MRHRKTGAKLGRSTSHRRAMIRNMVTSLFEHERVVTTEAKAKAVRPVAEKMITLAKRGDLHARRQALSFLTKKTITHKLFAEIKDRYMDRPGGYTSIVRIGPRRGDSAEMAVLELINPEERAKAAKKKTKKKAKKKAAPAKAEAAPAKDEAKVEEPAPAEEPVEEKAAVESAAEEVKAEAEEKVEAEATAEPEEKVEAEATAEPEAVEEPAAEEAEKPEEK